MGSCLYKIKLFFSPVNLSYINYQASQKPRRETFSAPTTARACRLEAGVKGHAKGCHAEGCASTGMRDTAPGQGERLTFTELPSR